MEFKDRLKALRKEKKLTQVKLGEMLNYGYTAIANYESGRNQPSISDLKKIASIFNVSMDYLLGVNDIRYPYVIDDETATFNEFRRYYTLLEEDSNTASKPPVALRSSASDNRLLRLYQNGSKSPENQGFPGFCYI